MSTTGDGNVLGGGGNEPGGGSSTPMLSPDEVRRRRLVALESGSRGNVNSPASAISPPDPPAAAVEVVGPAQSSSSSPAPPQQTVPNFDDDEDAALQAALAMSLASESKSEPLAAAAPAREEAGKTRSEATKLPPTTQRKVQILEPPAANNDDSDEDMQAALALSLQQDTLDPAQNPKSAGQAPSAESTTSPSDTYFSRQNNKSMMFTTISYKITSEVPANMLEFHGIMWDSRHVAEGDQVRWLQQGIHFAASSDRASDDNAFSIVSNPGPWGIIQAHGGPCGVLASVQAELLRIILFGTQISEDNNFDMVYPSTTSSSNEESSSPSSVNNSLLNREIMDRALAMSLALILARSALTPAAADGDDIPKLTESVRLVLPVDTAVNGQARTWQDFEPWVSSSSLSSTATSSSLKTITIESISSEASSAAKRQKIETDTESENLEQRVHKLAHAVAKFLLERKDEHQHQPLEVFKQPGGVILFVMSLAFSRGVRLVQLEMDDPNSQLTTNFGHCGQELINLLLCGQSVSNVFDNTLSPSGDLICRGIQRRPAIGYLSQLEALRYCEVGGYYKSPRFPIFVIGSQSHFTVMFAESDSCLQESQSDGLLEKCRRAFKQIPGGEENGFIQKDDLSKFLSSLDLKYSEHEIQTLAAAVEVHGAGIILWDDLWRRVSRLMTGASLQAILSGDATNTNSNTGADNDLPPLLITQHGEGASNSDPIRLDGVGTPMELDSQPLSDEELARRLQEEWNSEPVPSGTLSVAAVRGSPTPDSWQSHEHLVSTSNGGASNSNSTTSNQNDPTESKKPSAKSSAKLPYENDSRTFQLFHYNGLRGGTMTPFRVTKMSPEEAVGASTGLAGNAGGGFHGDLEDVVRTRWPSSAINWLGKTPPSID